MTDGTAYDYIIVGAGSAGCVLAGRLTEDPDVSVLILEAGGKDSDPLIHIPLGMGKMHETRKHDWGYDAEPEDSMNGRAVEAARGKVVGGSSSINVMAWVRGNAGDYDRWAQKGCIGWSFADCLPYFKKAEDWEEGADDYRATGGPLGVITAKTTDPLFDDWVKAGAEAGHGFTDDYNGGQQEGFGRSQSSIKNGKRCSAAVAYLHPALSRPNLTLETNALAAKVETENGRATGVTYSQNGKTVTARAEREVILSGGVFNSAQLLMLSGIGPADHLKDIGIDPVVDLKGVGQNLQDHLAVMLTYNRTHPGPFHAEMRFDRMAVSMIRAHLFGTGPATVLPGGLHAFIKTRPELAVPDIQFLFRGAPTSAALWFPGIKKAYTDGFGIRPVLLHPESRGELLLRSANPADPIRIRQNFLSVEDDLITLRNGVKAADAVMQQPAIAPHIAEETTPGLKSKSDADIDAWIRQTAVTAHHPMGTCKMGTDEMAVVDLDLRVRGIEDLRVVDASAMPDLVSGNINACVIMMAEKAADRIKGRDPLPRAEAA